MPFLKELYPLIVTALLILGCGTTNDPPPKHDKPSTKETNQRHFLSVGTAPPGGAFFVVGGAIAQVVDTHTSDPTWQISAEATKGTQENIRRLVQGDLDFALANAAISYFAVRGEGAWGTIHPIRSIMTLAPNIALFITQKKSGINSLAALKDKRVVVGPAGAGFEYFLQPILAAHGISYDDFTPLHNTQAGAVDMLADGSAAAAFLGGAVPTASISQACAVQDITFIPFDPIIKENLFSTFPFFHAATIPADTYRGQETPFEGMNVGAMQLITAANVPEKIVYNFTKTLYENRTEVVKRHPAGKAINPKNIIKNTGTPFHPGAIRYYQEIGIWPTDLP